MTRAEDGTERLAEVRERLARFRADAARVSDDDLLDLRRLARSAIDRLDDEPEFDEAHRLLDEVGKFVRENRGQLCILEEDERDFKQTCPVDLGHVRLGLSVGVEVLESECSICGEDPWLCPHIPGRDYDGEIAVRIIKRAEFFEVSIVSRPDFADARILSVPRSRSTVEAEIGHSVPKGTPLYCGRCLLACPGVKDSIRAFH